MAVAAADQFSRFLRIIARAITTNINSAYQRDVNLMARVVNALPGNNRIHSRTLNHNQTTVAAITTINISVSRLKAVSTTTVVVRVVNKVADIRNLYVDMSVQQRMITTRTMVAQLIWVEVAQTMMRHGRRCMSAIVTTRLVL